MKFKCHFHVCALVCCVAPALASVSYGLLRIVCFSVCFSVFSAHDRISWDLGDILQVISKDHYIPFGLPAFGRWPRE